MEIKAAFATIIGILMMVTVTVATIAIMGGLTQIGVEECGPAEYKADVAYTGDSCGYISTVEVYCKEIHRSAEDAVSDSCFNENKNLCCPTTLSGTSWRVVVANGRCCNNTKIGASKDVQCSTHNIEADCTSAGCKWCKQCQSDVLHSVNQWDADKCVGPVTDCGYHCEKNKCTASCQSDSDCIPGIQHCSISTGLCVCEQYRSFPG